MALDPLLKYFIELAISYKEFCTVEADIGDQLYQLDEDETHFHLEYLEGGKLCQVWKRKDWLDSIERYNRIKEVSSRERQIRFEKEEKIAKAKGRLLKIMSEKEAGELLFRIMEKGELPEIKIKLGL